MNTSESTTDGTAREGLRVHRLTLWYENGPDEVLVLSDLDETEFRSYVIRESRTKTIPVVRIIRGRHVEALIFTSQLRGLLFEGWEWHE